MFEISDSDIQYAENLLLPAGKTFDQERINFIKCFDTIDLQAVPGSGKTTALLAKLVILEKKMPFKDNSGVLVISHTNAAVDEIKHKLSAICPKLFRYPNFVGTIQSFVDHFLAIPYYNQKFKKKPIRIDNEIYDEVAVKKYRSLPSSSLTKRKLYRRNNPEEVFKNLRFDSSLNLVEGLNGKTFLLSRSASPTYLEIKQIKDHIAESGFLHFDDAYVLANQYIDKFPDLKLILQNRFKMVFVDEMQDMDVHQYQILEDIFYNNNESASVYQRIGDKNQSIYGGYIHINEVWNNRSTVLTLNGSHRLTSPIAKLVNYFAIDRNNGFEIIGQREGSVKPILFVYSNDNIQKVFDSYVFKIRQLRQDGQIALTSKYPIKAICWNADYKNADDINDITKIRLIDYYKEYKKEFIKKSKDYSCLKKYLIYYDRESNSFNSIRKNILNSFLKILRLEGVNSVNRNFTKKTLLKHLKSLSKGASSDMYDCFLVNLYEWSLNIVKGETDLVWNSIKNYIPIFLKGFGNYSVANSMNFVSDDIEPISNEESMAMHIKASNILTIDDIDVEVATVHSVKGQTHFATLYLESYFKRGFGSYESERLRNQFQTNESLSETLDKMTNSKDLIIQSAKMAYVGFSRPTDLLCVAVHKDRFEGVLKDIQQEFWEVEHIN